MVSCRKSQVEMDSLALRSSWEAAKLPGAITVTGLLLQVNFVKIMEEYLDLENLYLHERE